MAVLRPTQHIMMVCLALLLLLCELQLVNSYMPNPEKFDAPSLSIRGALKAAIEHDYEDVIVMQAEMAWGAQEMKRYQAIRGQWPVRTPSVVTENENQTSLFRGSSSDPQAPPPTTADGTVDYWAYLVSIF